MGYSDRHEAFCGDLSFWIGNAVRAQGGWGEGYATRPMEQDCKDRYVHVGSDVSTRRVMWSWFQDRVWGLTKASAMGSALWNPACCVESAPHGSTSCSFNGIFGRIRHRRSSIVALQWGRGGGGAGAPAVTEFVRPAGAAWTRPQRRLACPAGSSFVVTTGWWSGRLASCSYLLRQAQRHGVFSPKIGRAHV